jgi:hypothetical protein
MIIKTWYKASADALARGNEQLVHLEKDRDEVAVLVATEAADRARQFEDGIADVIKAGASRKRRDADDKIASMAATVEILTAKDAVAKRAIGECEAALAAAVKGVISEEAEPLLSRVHDLENAAACLRSQLRALQFSGRWGLCPETLPPRLAREPANIFHTDRPLAWEKQKAFDRRKAAWRTFADQLRENADATLNLGD